MSNGGILNLRNNIYYLFHGIFLFHEDITINGASKEAESEFMQKYPAIYNHLLIFKKRLESRNRAETGIRYEWYALQRCAATYWREFEKPKIILGIFMNKATFAYDKKGYYINNALDMIPETNEYVVAILNSSVSWWFLTQICTDLQNGYLQAYREKLFQIPIPDANLDTQSVIIKLVSRIPEAKSKKEVQDIEKQIDQLVYQLYGLTEKEIAIVESII